MTKASDIHPMNYLLVYKVDQHSIDNLQDVGDDPCFDCPPSWGICRPDVRNSKNLHVGSYLIFIANINKQYFVKGYFKVSAIVDIIGALEKFPNRQNVIISATDSKVLKLPWNYRNRHDIWKNTGRKRNPKFLRKFIHNNIPYYQRTNDGHQIDKWKCSGIFNCYISTFEKCAVKNKCIKENTGLPLKKNYIIGSKTEYCDWNQLRVEWHEIASYINKPEILMNNAHRHNEIPISIKEVRKLISYMSKRKPK